MTGCGGDADQCHRHDGKQTTHRSVRSFKTRGVLLIGLSGGRIYAARPIGVPYIR